MGASASNPRARRGVHETVDGGIARSYNVGRRIGRGCYGVVFEARKWGVQDENDMVAIKKTLHAFKTPTDAQRAYREVAYLSAFGSHDNICGLREVMKSIDDKHLYIVLELLDSDLQKAMRNAVLKDVHALSIVYQLFRALKFVHSAGVIHRDVKPANILLNIHCEVRLGDFGWARAAPVSGEVEAPFTEYTGSRWYRCPEVLLGARSYGMAVDVWAVGCIAAEVRMRRPLFGGTCTIDMVDHQVATLGKPSPADILALDSEYAAFTYEPMPEEPPATPLTTHLPGETPMFIDFVSLILQINPLKRCTSAEALMHPAIGFFHNPDDEPTFGRRIVLGLEDGELLESAAYRDQIYADYVGWPRARQKVEAARRRRVRQLEDKQLQAEAQARKAESAAKKRRPDELNP